MAGERAASCAHLHPRQALWKEEEVCASVFGQLGRGSVFAACWIAFWKTALRKQCTADLWLGQAPSCLEV